MRSGEAYAQARADGRAALVGYLPAGFPSYDGCIAALTAMVKAGVDIVEVGLPYSDPVIDGPTIQAAADQALRNGTRVADVLRTIQAGGDQALRHGPPGADVLPQVGAVAATGAAAVVMTYWNPVLRYGVDRFA